MGWLQSWQLAPSFCHLPWVTDVIPAFVHNTKQEHHAQRAPDISVALLGVDIEFDICTYIFLFHLHDNLYFPYCPWQKNQGLCAE